MNQTSPASPCTGRSEGILAIGVSGGLDSTVAYHYARLHFTAWTLRPVFFNLGQPYAAKERAALTRLEIPFEEVALPLVAFQGIEPTPEAQIIPARNLVIAAWLGAAAEVVWVVGTANDMAGHTPDKCPAFYQTATAALTQAVGREVRVRTPFGDWSKQQIIQWSVASGLGHLLPHTVSCYHPALPRCGACKVCVERYLSFFLAGYETSDQFSRFPPWSEAACALRRRYREALAARDFSRYPEGRIRLHLQAFSILDTSKRPPTIDWLREKVYLPASWGPDWGTS